MINYRRVINNTDLDVEIILYLYQGGRRGRMFGSRRLFLCAGEQGQVNFTGFVNKSISSIRVSISEHNGETVLFDMSQQVNDRVDRWLNDSAEIVLNPVRIALMESVNSTVELAIAG